MPGLSPWHAATTNTTLSGGVGQARPGSRAERKDSEAFASERRVSPGTLSWWRWRLTRKGGCERSRSADPSGEETAIRLLPVELEPDENGDAPGWTVHFASGHELRVRSALSAADLELVVRALRAGGRDR